MPVTSRQLKVRARVAALAATSGGLSEGSMSTTWMFQGASSWRSASHSAAKALSGAAPAPPDPIIRIRARAWRSSGTNACVTANCPDTGLSA